MTAINLILIVLVAALIAVALVVPCLVWRSLIVREEVILETMQNQTAAMQLLIDDTDRLYQCINREGRDTIGKLWDLSDRECARRKLPVSEIIPPEKKGEIEP